MKTTIKLAVSVAFSMFLLSAMPSVASAQEDVSQKQIPSLELEQADVREALRALFKNVNVSYSIAPEVQGPVTVSLKNVTFEAALQNVLRQVDATYRVEGGVYEIVKRQESVVPVGQNNENTLKTTTLITRRIKILHADPGFIASMIGRKGGNQNYTIAPEQSTISKTPAGGGTGGLGGGGGMNGGMGGTGGMNGGGSMGGGGFGGGSGGFGGGNFGGGRGGGGGGGGL